MPKFYSELQQASLENLAADPSVGTAGRIFRNTVDGKAKIDTGAAITSIVTETQTQTLTNKTLTSPAINSPTITTPTVDIETLDGQGSTPSNPSAGFYKSYIKDADGYPYLLNSAGTETKILAASLATAKGDILAATASNAISRLAVGTNGQVLKANSAQASGLEWGSGVANLSVRSVTTTDTCTSADDVLLLSGASFTQTLFTAVGNTGKVLTICHAGTSITNEYTLNTTGGQTIGGIASGSYVLFTNGERLKIVSDGTNWQILDHYTHTDWSTPGAITITATTSNPSKGTIVTDTISWCRSGKNAKIIMSYRQSAAGSAGTGDYLFALPSGLTADNTTFPYYTTVLGGNSPLATNAFGIFASSLSTTQENMGHVSMYDSTKFRGLLYAPTGDGAASASYYGLNDTSIAYAASFEVPIANWRP